MQRSYSTKTNTADLTVNGDASFTQERLTLRGGGLSPANMLTLFHRAELCTFVANFPSVKMQEKAAAETNHESSFCQSRSPRERTEQNEDNCQGRREAAMEEKQASEQTRAGGYVFCRMENLLPCCFPCQTTVAARTLFGRDAFIQDSLL